jgi:dienelactone hydrolase
MMLLPLMLAACASTLAPSLAVPEQPFAIADWRPAPAPLPARLALPAGKGPFPVVILLHGCGGITANQSVWADRLADWGYASLILDSFAPRSVKSVCPPDMQHLVTPFDRAGDAWSAAVFLKSLPQIDATRIAVIGESHGGATAATLTASVFQAIDPGLIKASVDYYGVCRDPGGHGTIPLLALAGDADTWGNPARNCRAFGRALGSGQNFVVQIYPGVVHGFDQTLNRRSRWEEGHPMAYDSDAAEDSYRRVHAFLDQYLDVKSPARG